jgi:hypothetical protein
MKSRFARALLICQALLVPLPAMAAGHGTPDVVTTRSGASYRGTIIEQVPGDHTSILLPNGETRVIPASEIVTGLPALPAQQEERPAQPTTSVVMLGIGDTTPKTSHGPPALVKFESDEPGLTVYRRMDDGFGSGSVALTTTGSPAVSAASLSRFTPICTAPCAMEIPTGTTALGIGKGPMPAIPASEVLALNGPATVDVSMTDRSSMRHALGWVSFAGLLAGTGMVLGSLAKKPSEDEGFSSKDAVLAAGIGAAGVGLVAGLWALVAGQDEAHVRLATPVAATTAKR